MIGDAKMKRGRKPKCKNCECCKSVVLESGFVDWRCEELDDSVNPDGAPMCNPCVFVRRRKKRLSAEEVSKIRSAAAKKLWSTKERRGKCHGSTATRHLRVRAHDYAVFVFCADLAGRSVAEQMHRLATFLIRKHPNAKPPDWVD